MYSGEIWAISATSGRSSVASASVSWMSRPLGNPANGLRGAAAEQDHDPVAQPVEALLRLPLEPHAERQQHHHRHRPPGNAEDGEGGAQLLGPDVGEELARTPQVISLGGFSMHQLTLGEPLEHLDVDRVARARS